MEGFQEREDDIVLEFEFTLSRVSGPPAWRTLMNIPAP